jgi:protein SCO1/2
VKLPVLLAALALTGCTASPAATTSAEPTLHGSVPGRVTPRPHFTLVDTSGAPYDFYAKTKGRVTLLFWGYTHCADTCPATLHSISIALHRVPAKVRQNVIVVFVTSDPARDTGPVIRRWLDRIDPSFVGLTGTARQVRAAEKATGVPPAEREPGKGSAYDVGHYAGTLAYGTDDSMAAVYTSQAGARDYAADLPVLVGEESSR